MKKLYIFFLVYCAFPVLAQTTLTGRVMDTGGKPLAGAGIVLVAAGAGNRAFVSAEDGTFALPAPPGTVSLRVTYIGYRDTLVRLDARDRRPLTITLALAGNLKEEVTVSTGYQEVPKERATGSFVQVDRALLERSVSTSLTDRLRDVVPGLAFIPGNSTFRVRGQSTLFSNAEPLIVVDGFPYNEPVSTINPNDVESISVLKDAAAASIWGSKAGNGVVVVTTKRGAFNKPPQVSFSGTVQVGARPDVFYGGRMSSADYIAIEKQLFGQGYYTATEASTQHLPLSPVVELLIAQRDGKLSAASVAGQIDALGRQDIRADVSEYLYRPAVNQQYAASVSGGGPDERYYFSAGADRNLDNARGNGFDRVTFKGSETWTFFRKKLEFSAGLNLTETKTGNNNPGTLTWNRGSLVYPYAALKDAAGNNAALTRDYRQGFLASAQQLGLLDWQYRPLDELGDADNTGKLTDQRINTGLRYRLPAGFSIQALYQYDHGLASGRNLQSQDSYYTRNLVNRFTQVSGTTLSRPVPLGGILDLSSSTSVNHDGRLQLAYDHSFGSRHELTGIAGYEVQTLRVLGDGNRFYGYDSGHATTRPVDGVTLYSYYDNPASGTAVPLNNYETDGTDHYLSYYANAAYTYDRRLTLSGSARLDESNLFGVNANQKGVPLWSVGTAWNISREGFYKLDWLPELKLRATFGYNGNINKNLSAYTTASYFDGSDQGTLLPYARIINPPNSELRWERVRHTNLGLDFGTRGGRVTGTVEYYWKAGLDLIGSTAYAPSTGITVFTGNTAGSNGHGMDLNVTTRNLAGKLAWTTDYLLSYVSDKVTSYNQTSTTASYLQSGAAGGYALLGYPLYSLYSYKWAGLDPQTGDPQGYLNGAVSKNYTAIAAATGPKDLVYNGPARPVFTGAVRNTVSYRSFCLSANISYEFGFYFRKTSLRSGNDDGLTQQSADYALRWQRPGDEANTYVPSVSAVPNTARDDFYTYSSVLVQKGDNIRLRDVRLSYQWQRVNFYIYAADLGILWRANKAGLDPDFNNNYPTPRTIAGGIRLTY